MTDERDSPRLISEDFERIFKAEIGYVWNALRRLGVREADLADQAHEVFLTFHRRLDVYDSTRPVRPWLFGIASRTASDYRRLARNRRETPDDEVERVDSSPDAEEQVATHQARRLVLRALDRVADERRPVLVMHDIEGHTMPEIATALEIPLNTGYSRLRLARKEFAEAVRELDPEAT